MARPVEKVSRQVRRALIREAGGKCANPGCSTQRTHIHHVEFRVYATNDQKTLIAICPTCHDAVHYGSLEITDEMLYAWKQLRRSDEHRGHIYVEPGGQTKLLLGTIAVTGPTGVRVFDLSPNHRLGFRIVDGDIMLIDLGLHNHSGKPIVRLTGGHVRVLANDVEFDQRPGRISITAPIGATYLPDWALNQFRRQDPGYASDGRLVLLDLEVVEPGLVRVQGIWAHDERAVIISAERLSFIWPGGREPLSLMGAGAESVLNYVGPISASLFGYEHGPPSALKVGPPLK